MESVPGRALGRILLLSYVPAHELWAGRKAAFHPEKPVAPQRRKIIFDLAPRVDGVDSADDLLTEVRWTSTCSAVAIGRPRRTKP
jgi:hypothetical protein